MQLKKSSVTTKYATVTHVDTEMIRPCALEETILYLKSSR